MKIKTMSTMMIMRFKMRTTRKTIDQMLFYLNHHIKNWSKIKNQIYQILTKQLIKFLQTILINLSLKTGH